MSRGLVVTPNARFRARPVSRYLVTLECRRVSDSYTRTFGFAPIAPFYFASYERRVAMRYERSITDVIASTY